MKKQKTQLVKLEDEIKAVLTTPLHLRVEYFFRKRYILLAVLALLGVAMAKSEGGFLSNMREAYHFGYSRVGSYLRNETVHTSHVAAPVRVIVAASK